MFIGSTQEPRLVKTKINRNISMLLPEEFVVMSEQDVNEKIVTPNQSIALYTNPSRRVDLAINLSTNYWDDFDLMRDFYKSSLMSLFSEIEFLSEDVKMINNRKYAVFEFISAVKDQRSTTVSQAKSVRRYYYIQYTLFDNKSLFFNLTAPASEGSYWAGRAGAIMSSIKIK